MILKYLAVTCFRYQYVIAITSLVITNFIITLNTIVVTCAFRNSLDIGTREKTLSNLGNREIYDIKKRTFYSEIFHNTLALKLLY